VDVAKLTLPVNVPVSFTVIVSVPVDPAATERAVADGLSVKPEAAGTVSVTDVVAVSDPEVPVMVIG
jgi:hypothetical protein